VETIDDSHVCAEFVAALERKQSDNNIRNIHGFQVRCSELGVEELWLLWRVSTWFLPISAFLGSTTNPADAFTMLKRKTGDLT
jgi:hypothetical protein